MKIDMAPILRGKTDRLQIDYPLNVESSFPRVTFAGPVRIRGEIRNNAGYISVDFTAELDYRTYCDRCMIPVERSLSIPFKKTAAPKGTLEREDDNDDYILIEENMIDADSLLEEALILDFPTKHLCREDCKGLCCRCGKDLNEGPCGCREEREDPRWAAIRAGLPE